MSFSFSYGVLCIVCRKQRDLDPGKGWDTVALGARCGECAARNLQPVTAQGEVA